MEPTSRDNRVGQSATPWLWGLAGTYLLVGCSGWFPPGYRAADLGIPYLAYLGAKSVIECWLVFWAARRLGLGNRLRLSLRMTGCAFALSAFNALWLIPGELGWVKPIPSALSACVTFLTYALGLVGILWMPTRTTRRSAWWEVAFDLGAAVLGMSVALALVITMPRITVTADPSARYFALAYGGAQTLMLIGLNVLVLRGVARPSRRAFWLFVSMVFLNLVNVVIYQIESSAGPAASLRVSEFANALISVCTLWMAFAFRTDPLAAGELAPGPDWFSTFNPLPLLATAGVALLLLVGAYIPGSWNLRVLAPVMVLLVLLTLARLFLTSHENARLLREETAHVRQRQEEKVAAIRRLAGGMAHWYSNLLTAVVGRAEIGSTAEELAPSTRNDFNVILEAADRAGRITHQLLSYGGGTFLLPMTFDLSAALCELGNQLTRDLPPAVKLHVSTPGEPVLVHADLARINSVISELVTNATTAMPAGGLISINLRRERVQASTAPCPLPVQAGDFAVLEIEDSGQGIPEADLRWLFDPFFTTQPLHAAAGLGLAEVYGIIAEHGGGLAVQSEPGRGTRFTLHLPLERPV